MLMIRNPMQGEKERISNRNVAVIDHEPMMYRSRFVQ